MDWSSDAPVSLPQRGPIRLDRVGNTGPFDGLSLSYDAPSFEDDARPSGSTVPEPTPTRTDTGPFDNLSLSHNTPSFEDDDPRPGGSMILEPTPTTTDPASSDGLGSPLTSVDTPGAETVDLPKEGNKLPMVLPGTKDFAACVLGWELSKDAPVIDWPGGYKTVVPFIQSKKNPEVNVLGLVRHTYYPS